MTENWCGLNFMARWIWEGTADITTHRQNCISNLWTPLKLKFLTYTSCTFTISGHTKIFFFYYLQNIKYNQYNTKTEMVLYHTLLSSISVYIYIYLSFNLQTSDLEGFRAYLCIFLNARKVQESTCHHFYFLHFFPLGIFI